MTMADLPSMRPLPPLRPPGRGKERKRIGLHRLLLIGIILIQIIGFAFLWVKISAPPSAAAPPMIDPATAIAAMKPPDEQLIRESIRNILKDELQAYVEQLQQQQQQLQKLQTRQEKPRVAASGGGDTVTPRSRPPANPEVVQETMAIVDRALASGVWTDADNNALLKLTPQLSEAQRVELLEKIFGAINRQQLKAVGSLPSL